MSPPTTPEQRSYYQVGDIVSYRPVEGRPYTSIGTIIEVLDQPSGRMLPMSRRGTVMSNASKGNPNYLIRNELTGKITLYRHTAVDERKYPPVESK
ncbi:hypothetical protein LRAMOSA09965 [Lichtheimia ramosa]|uniref:Hypervirulence associated protein TUDOR domain-containing protein n=1 Tax=Lichtheimia ramosa TaxID=688394 RepID=A0A077WNE4_9FUNG|nr:hypothetical protein LRAMOSA09965 [Lichtheimia ramosa]